MSKFSELFKKCLGKFENLYKRPGVFKCVKNVAKIFRHSQDCLDNPQNLIKSAQNRSKY